MLNADLPELATGFRWVPAAWGYRLHADALEGFSHGWTTRQLALRGSPDQEAQAWADVAAAGERDPAALVRLRQVHGAIVHCPNGSGPVADRPQADAALSSDASILLTVQVADCVPIVFGDSSTNTVAVAHAGWRGTAKGIAGATLSALARHRVRVTDVVAAIGPSIGPCCYRVGAELVDAFRDAGWPKETATWFEQRADGWYLDLWRANTDQLVQQGVRRDAVHVAGLCTACHPGWFFSYRREGAGTGRMAAYVAARR
jgi:purine-nucleoside/S-methyl-5'-thioadenosine phosphorylase / adenosine deaminase